MRPVRLSLEDIFLQLTTTEEEEDEPHETAQSTANQESAQAQQTESIDE